MLIIAVVALLAVIAFGAIGCLLELNDINNNVRALLGAIDKQNEALAEMRGPSLSPPLANPPPNPPFPLSTRRKS